MQRIRLTQSLRRWSCSACSAGRPRVPPPVCLAPVSRLPFPPFNGASLYRLPLAYWTRRPFSDGLNISTQTTTDQSTREDEEDVKFLTLLGLEKDATSFQVWQAYEDRKTSNEHLKWSQDDYFRLLWLLTKPRGITQIERKEEFSSATRESHENEATRAASTTPATEVLSLFSCARKMLDDMIRDARLQPELRHYIQLLAASLFEPTIDAMESVLSEIQQRRLDLDETAYFMIIQNFARRARYHEAEEWFARAKERGLHMDNVKVFTELIVANAEAKEMGRAQAVFEDMRARGIEPNIRTYNALLNGYIGVRDPQSVHSLLLEMRHRQIEYNKVTYHLLLKHYGTQNRLEQLAETYREMRTKFVPDRATYNQLLLAYGQLNRVADMVRIYSNMRHHGVQPSWRTYNVLLSALAESFTPTGQETEALRKSDSKQDLSNIDDTYSDSRSTIPKEGEEDDHVSPESVENVLQLMISNSIPLQKSTISALLRYYHTSFSGGGERMMQLWEYVLRNHANPQAVIVPYWSRLFWEMLMLNKSNGDVCDQLWNQWLALKDELVSTKEPSDSDKHIPKELHQVISHPLSAYLRSLMRRDQWKKAHELVIEHDAANTLGTYFYRDIFEICLHEEDLSRAMDILQASKSMNSERPTYSAILRLARIFCHDSEQIQRLFWAVEECLDARWDRTVRRYIPISMSTVKALNESALMLIDSFKRTFFDAPTQNKFFADTFAENALSVTNTDVGTDQPRFLDEQLRLLEIMEAIGDSELRMKALHVFNVTLESRLWTELLAVSTLLARANWDVASDLGEYNLGNELLRKLINRRVPTSIEKKTEEIAKQIDCIEKVAKLFSCEFPLEELQASIIQQHGPPTWQRLCETAPALIRRVKRPKKTVLSREKPTKKQATTFTESEETNSSLSRTAEHRANAQLDHVVADHIPERVGRLTSKLGRRMRKHRREDLSSMVQEYLQSSNSLNGKNKASNTETLDTQTLLQEIISLIRTASDIRLFVKAITAPNVRQLEELFRAILSTPALEPFHAQIINSLFTSYSTKYIGGPPTRYIMQIWCKYSTKKYRHLSNSLYRAGLLNYSVAKQNIEVLLENGWDVEEILAVLNDMVLLQGHFESTTREENEEKLKWIKGVHEKIRNQVTLPKSKSQLDLMMDAVNEQLGLNNAPVVKNRR